MFLTYLDEPDKRVRQWAISKKSALMRSALCRAATRIDHHIWDTARHNTNAVEQTHNKTYAWDKKRLF
jgi:hypothetical protein